MKIRAISDLGATLVAILILAACGRPGPTTDGNQMPPQAMQESSNIVVEPHRYIRLGDLAGAIRKAGHPCEGVRAYKLIKQYDEASAVYKVDCLEYSFLITFINGQSRIEPLTKRVAG